MKFFENIADSDFVGSIQRYIEKILEMLSSGYDKNPVLYSISLGFIAVFVIAYLSYTAGKRSRADYTHEKKKIRYDEIDWTISRENESMDEEASTLNVQSAKMPEESNFEKLPVMQQRNYSTEPATSIPPQIYGAADFPTSNSEKSELPPLNATNAELPPLMPEQRATNSETPQPETLNKERVEQQPPETVSETASPEKPAANGYDFIGDASATAETGDLSGDSKGQGATEELTDIVRRYLRREPETHNAEPKAILSTAQEQEAVKVEKINLIKAVPYRKFGPDNNNTNRSGRIFTEEELRKQIRD